MASDALGDAKWFIKKATEYACERKVFGRPIGQNQGIQHPLAECWAYLESAYWLAMRAASLDPSPARDRQ